MLPPGPLKDLFNEITTTRATLQAQLTKLRELALASTLKPTSMTVSNIQEAEAVIGSAHMQLEESVAFVRETMRDVADARQNLWKNYATRSIDARADARADSKGDDAA